MSRYNHNDGEYRYEARIAKIYKYAEEGFGYCSTRSKHTLKSQELGAALKNDYVQYCIDKSGIPSIMGAWERISFVQYSIITTTKAACLKIQANYLRKNMSNQLGLLQYLFPGIIVKEIHM